MLKDMSEYRMLVNEFGVSESKKYWIVLTMLSLRKVMPHLNRLGKKQSILIFLISLLSENLNHILHLKCAYYPFWCSI